VNGDALAPRRRLETDLVLELGRDTVPEEPLYFLDIEIRDHGGHPARLTTSAGQTSVSERVMGNSNWAQRI
jgi:hypothetical protein